MYILNLFVPNIENKLREGAISSRIAILTLIDIIYISMIQKDLDSSQLKLEASKKAMDYLKV